MLRAYKALSLLFCFIGLSSQAWANKEMAKPFSQDAAQDPSKPISFSADEVAYSWTQNAIAAQGNIHLAQKDTNIKGNRLMVSIDRQLVTLDGDVQVSKDTQTFYGKRAIYDLKDDTGTFEEGRGAQEPFKFWGKEMEKVGPKRIEVHRGSLTTCNLGVPHYRLAPREIVIIPEDRVVGKHTIIYVGETPVLYWPYYSQSLVSGQSNFQISYGKESHVGTFLRTGYNLIESDRFSQTLHADLYSKSGIAYGVDGRFRLLGKKSEGLYNLYYVEDQNEENFEEDDPQDFIQEERGRADVYLRQPLTRSLTAHLQVEALSDPDILKDFFFNEFENREPPESFFNLTYANPTRVASLTGRKRLDDFQTTVERLPEAKFDLLEQRLFGTDVFYSFQNTFTKLKSQPQEEEIDRNRTLFKLSRPTRLFDFVTFVPFAEADFTYFSEDKEGDNRTRSAPFAGLIMESRFHRMFSSPFDSYKAFRHLLIPTLTLSTRREPTVKPEDLLFFDEVDLLDEQNSLELELRQYLQGKNKYGYNLQLVKLTTTIDFDFSRPEDTLDTIENELLLTPHRDWKLILVSLKEFEKSKESENVYAKLTYFYKNLWGASLGYEYNNSGFVPFDGDIKVSFATKLGTKWKVGTELRYATDQSDFDRKEIRLWRDLHDWEVMLVYRERRETTSVLFLFNIKAFPDSRIQKAFSEIRGG